jgi:hypothetical protein
MSVAAISRGGIFSLGFNVRYEHRDKDGNIKQLFTENQFGKALLKYFREQVKEPIDSATGQVKPGLKNYLAAYGLRIPYVTGRWSSKRNIHNLITNAGFAGAASRLNGAGSEAAFVYIAVGIGTTGEAVGNTTLESEVVDSGLERASATASRVTVDVTNDGARLVHTFSVTGTKAITESGVLNAGSGGTLLARQTFSAVNVVNGDTLAVTWTFDFDA